jgi:hypothetical protein
MMLTISFPGRVLKGDVITGFLNGKLVNKSERCLFRHELRNLLRDETDVIEDEEHSNLPNDLPLVYEKLVASKLVGTE